MPPGERIQFTGEASRLMGNDDHLSLGSRLHDLHLSLYQNKQRHIRVALFNHHLSAIDTMPFSMGSNALDLSGCELRKHLFPAFGRRDRYASHCDHSMPMSIVRTQDSERAWKSRFPAYASPLQTVVSTTPRDRPE